MVGDDIYTFSTFAPENQNLDERKNAHIAPYVPLDKGTYCDSAGIESVYVYDTMKHQLSHIFKSTSIRVERINENNIVEHEK